MPERHVADLVEKDGAAVGLRNRPGRPFYGTGKGASLHVHRARSAAETPGAPRSLSRDERPVCDLAVASLLSARPLAISSFPVSALARADTIVESVFASAARRALEHLVSFFAFSPLMLSNP
jgi:hypothetical protein